MKKRPQKRALFSPLLMAGIHQRVDDAQVGFHQLLRAAPAAGFAVEITPIAAQVT